MKIEINGWSELEQGITDIIRYVRNPVGTFARAKAIMLQDVMQHFKNEEGPFGDWEGITKKWAPLKLSTLRHRRKKGKGAKILQDTGRLRASITGVSTGTGAEVGTNLVYAAVQQFGSKDGKIPPRTYIWLSKDAKDRILSQFVLDMREL